ncbi:MAG: nucleotidyltransferase family protein [Clostridia bacterium]|nr:nucleotidyltransferase family protein [Clostridia bacterium]
MSYCAIIAEFNPFTNGHEYIIHQAKKKTGLDVICLMSGNMVQRGEMSCLDKYTRGIHAIKLGADMVFELPTAYALSSADDFGGGAVKCLSELGCVTHIAFGVETKFTDILDKIAKFKATETESFKKSLKTFMKNGDSYSVASYKAYLEEFGDFEEQLKDIFASPNNILALSYVSAIYRDKLAITPVYIERIDNGYNSCNEQVITVDGNEKKFAGASHIRNLVLEGKINQTKELVPLCVYEDLKQLDSKLEGKMNISKTLLLSSIRSKTLEELKKYHDYNTSLSSLIFKAVSTNGTFEEVVSACTSKAHREQRIRKLLTYPYLELSSSLMENTKKQTSIVNLLVCKADKKEKLREIISGSKAKIIVSTTDYNNLNEQEKEILSLNQKGTNLYNLSSSLPASIDKARFV